jgi:eukaryotic-like serine/threonine-protein kinase
MSTQGQQVFNGRYELRRKIARGGMADVFLAHDVMLNRPVAVKVLFPEFAVDPAFVQRFRGEAQAAANLGHPNIVSIFDWGEQDGTYYIVMEYVEGASLAQILRDEGPMEPRRAADIAADIASALGFAHSSGVIHRDVKPGNVLLSPTGQVKVTDFGIARAVSSQENLTQTGTVMGTATYFSPEQARGEAVDGRSDVYSLGIVLYEMLAGRPPFSGDSPVAVAYKHVQEQAEPVANLRPDVPPDLALVVHQAMAKDPDDRYGSAEAFREDLRRFSGGQPVMASAFADATSAVGAPTSAMAATSAVGATRAAPRYEDTWAAATGDDYYDEPPKKRKPVFIVALVVLLALLVGALVLFANLVGFGGGGAEQVEVPDVVGLSAEDATARLDSAGFTVERESVASETVPVGDVVSQDPAGGTEADEGSEVTISVSEGPAPVDVPDVVGQQADVATATLEGAGFEVEQVDVPSDDAPEGEVVRQSPAGDQQAAPGSTVRIDVSGGPDDVPVPDVSGQSASEAANILGRCGFETTTREQASDSVPQGQVIGTDPSSGTSLAPGATVAIIVSTGPSTRQVPDVTGRSGDEAASALRQAGFEVVTQPRTVNRPGLAGQVVDQSPGGGSQASPGSTVTITVGEFFASEITTTTTTAPPDQGGGGGGGGGGEGGGD